MTQNQEKALKRLNRARIKAKKLFKSLSKLTSKEVIEKAETPINQLIDNMIDFFLMPPGSNPYSQYIDDQAPRTNYPANNIPYNFQDEDADRGPVSGGTAVNEGSPM